MNSILQRVKSQELNLSVVQLACVVDSFKDKEASDISISCTEILLSAALEEPEFACETGAAPSRVLCMLVEADVSHQESAERLASHLLFMPKIRMPASEQGWFFEFAWNVATSYADQEQWQSSVIMFECIYNLMEQCKTGSATDLAWCSATISLAKLRQARCTREKAEAHQLRQSVLISTEQTRAWLCLTKTGSKDSSLTALDSSLARCQFEAAVFLHSPSLGAVVESLLLAAGQDPSQMALLARIALEAEDEELAARCLWAYQAQISASGGEGQSAACRGAKVAAARREIVSLRVSDGTDELATACHEMTCSLQQLRLPEGAGLPESIAEKDALWLAAMTWNRGADLFAQTTEQMRAQKHVDWSLDLFRALGSVVGGEVKELHERLAIAHKKFAQSHEPQIV